MSYLHKQLTLIEHSPETILRNFSIKNRLTWYSTFSIFCYTRTFFSEWTLSQYLEMTHVKPGGTSRIVVFFSFFTYSLAHEGANIQFFKAYILACV